MHHPFTMPTDIDSFLAGKDLETMNAMSYDFVLNGIELGSGSIRIHREDIQKKMFEVLGLSDEEIQERFGFILEAFSYGTPPHGGFAFGLDRLVMIMSQSDSIRDVIAFPKTRDASCFLSQAPSRVDQDQLDILGISLGLEGDQLEKLGSRKNKTSLDLKELEDLSQLKLTQEEREEIGREVEELIQSASILEEVDIEGLEALINIHPLANASRKDQVERNFTREEVLANAPTVEDGYILVPKVIE